MRNEIFFTCDDTCERCKGVGLYQRGANRVICDCVESEIVPAEKPYGDTHELGTVPSNVEALRPVPDPDSDGGAA